jgi:dTDP-4-dehydrorhamnose reductase
VTGSQGQLGSSLMTSAPGSLNVFGRSRDDCDITDHRAVNAVFKELDPNVVINAAAYTAVDRAELEPAKAFAANAIGARNVADAARQAGARMIHISTDYVFDGSQTVPYTPASKARPLNTYGKSKLEGEQTVLATDETALVIRTGWLYSGGQNNFLQKILNRLLVNSPLKVVDDQVGVPTLTSDLALAIWSCVDLPGQRGIHHWVNNGTASWYEFAQRIREVALNAGILRSAAAVVPISSSSYPAGALRPSYSVLDSTSLWKVLGTPRHWHNALDDLLEDIASRAISREGKDHRGPSATKDSRNDTILS